MARILDKFLTIEHRQRGMTLTEDDHMVYLTKNGHTVAVWSAQGATLEGIHKEADRMLGGDAIKDTAAIGGIDIQPQ